jgi:uncharacterized protein YecT (DUF1311 family)
MTRLCIFLVLVFAVGCQQAAPHETAVTPDPELAQLEAALAAAMTQTDMNIASVKIAEFLDSKLASVEKQVARKLDNVEQERFAEFNERWRRYRIQDVQFWASFYEGGTIQPLVANNAYSAITAQRITELEDLLGSFAGRATITPDEPR